MDAELKFGMMALFIRANGKTTRRTEKEDSFMPTEMFMKENGSTTRLMGRECTLTLMELNMLATGKKISKTAMELKLGQMVPNILEPMSTGRNMARENLFGLTDQDTKDSSMTTTSMEMEFMNGPMAGNTTESG